MKIGMIAMSGIRVCDEELLRLGLTLPGFVERSKTIASLPSLGLLTLAGMTPKKHEVEYIEVPDIKALDTLPDGFDLIAISSYSAQIDEAYELAKRYKEAGTPVVLGGPHVTCLPEEAAGYCDSVVIGEGEVSWPGLLDDVESASLKPFYGSADESFDMADAPMPALELIWQHPFIEFADDNTFVDKKYWKKLLSELKNRKFKWFTETDISVSEDDELLDLMCDRGCAQVLIGLESPVETGLDGLELRSNWKLNRWSQYKEAIRKIQSHGITVNGCFIIGLDGQGPEIFEQVYEFVKDAELYEVQVTIQTAFPGTPLYDRLKREGRIQRDKDWKKCTLFDVNYLPKNMSPQELAEGFQNLVVRLYSDEFTKWRRGNFKKFLRERGAK
jgi:radical SAM superfamily enzyme YgiQ (UPF0313 family)